MRECTAKYSVRRSNAFHTSLSDAFDKEPRALGPTAISFLASQAISLPAQCTWAIPRWARTCTGIRCRTHLVLLRASQVFKERARPDRAAVSVHVDGIYGATGDSHAVRSFTRFRAKQSTICRRFG